MFRVLNSGFKTQGWRLWVGKSGSEVHALEDNSLEVMSLEVQTLEVRKLEVQTLEVQGSV